MTGNQLGRAIGLNKAFGTRITQYETNARIPRPEILKKREILKKDYIWAAVYVAGIGQYGNYPDDYLHDVEICQSFAC